MDISDTKPVGKVEATAPTRPLKSKAQGGQSKSWPQDKVTLSERSRLLDTARQKVKSMEEIDQQKVAEVKARLESGAYRVEADKLATKILQESFMHLLAK